MLDGLPKPPERAGPTPGATFSAEDDPPQSSREIGPEIDGRERWLIGYPARPSAFDVHERVKSPEVIGAFHGHAGPDIRQAENIGRYKPAEGLPPLREK